MRRPQVRVRMIAGHAPDCWAAENYRGGQWCFPETLVTHWKDRAGTDRGTSHRWFEVRCNCIRCPARAIVHELDVMLLVERALENGE